MTRKTIPIVLILLLMACARPTRELDAHQLFFGGYWGESLEDCAANPQENSFSTTGDVMTVRYKEGGTADNATLQPSFTYNVLAREEFGLHVQLVDEPRADSAGSPVSWRMLMVSPDSFCWQRSDWGADQCSPPRVRCGR